MRGGRLFNRIPQSRKLYRMPMRGGSLFNRIRQALRSHEPDRLPVSMSHSQTLWNEGVFCSQMSKISQATYSQKDMDDLVELESGGLLELQMWLNNANDDIYDQSLEDIDRIDHIDRMEDSMIL